MGLAGRQGTFASSMGTTAQRETGTALAELRARTALRGAGLDPSVPIERASSVTNEVWLTPDARRARQPPTRATASTARRSSPRPCRRRSATRRWSPTAAARARTGSSSSACRASRSPTCGPRLTDDGAVPGRRPAGRPTRGAAPHAGAAGPAADRERSAAARGGRGRSHRAGGRRPSRRAMQLDHVDPVMLAEAAELVDGPGLHPRAVRSRHARPRRRHLRERAVARGPGHRPPRRRVGSAGSTRPRPRHPAAVRRLPPAARRRRVRG